MRCRSPWDRFPKGADISSRLTDGTCTGSCNNDAPRFPLAARVAWPHRSSGFLFDIGWRLLLHLKDLKRYDIVEVLEET
jgi:hypothetical protein